MRETWGTRLGHPPVTPALQIFTNERGRRQSSTDSSEKREPTGRHGGTPTPVYASHRYGPHQKRGSGVPTIMKAKTAVLLVVLGWLAPVVCAAQYQQAPPPPEQASADQAPVQASPMSPDQLQQLVAPIALYPDSLVAQILAASTYPTQIVEAGRWLQSNPGLQGQALADAVNQQPWDPSVKALVQFPSVLSNLDQNLSWTQSLGDAYYNQPQDVMNAIQVMREKARAAGNLNSTPQQVVTNNGPQIVIAPANPNIVYVPTYDPWLIYGPPIPVWPGFVYGPVWVARPFFGFGIGINIGFFGGFGWGWPHWGLNWGARRVYYGGAPWVSRGPAFFDHRAYVRPEYRPGVGRAPQPYRGEAGRPVAPNRGEVPRPAEGYHGARTAEPYRGAAPSYHATAPRPVEPPVNRGFGSPRGQSGTHSGAFSGYAHGGTTNGYAQRGASSMGAAHGGGGEHGGGGGHGGGKH